MSPDLNTPTHSDPRQKVRLGRLTLENPVMVASGTFGYAREMSEIIDLSRLGAIVPKTITFDPRAGNRPPRTAETPAGLLNSIGLDNDGLDEFLRRKMPWLANLPTKIVVSIAGKSLEDFQKMAEVLDGADGVAALELNISCPNVSGGVNFATDPRLCEEVVAAVRTSTETPIIAKLTPNVTDIAVIAKAAESGGADAVAAINTCLGLSVDWRRRKPRLGNGFGGLSGPAIKPIALRAVAQIHRAVSIPIIGIGGIANVDDVMEFLVAGATAVQVGTANFYRPRVVHEILDALPGLLDLAEVEHLDDLIGTLEL
jgi:dihydroorotate dehydrogenase (NAD+) catalytic subunit